jgi:hypothetical protein
MASGVIMASVLAVGAPTAIAASRHPIDCHYSVPLQSGIAFGQVSHYSMPVPASVCYSIVTPVSAR